MADQQQNAPDQKDRGIAPEQVVKQGIAYWRMRFRAGSHFEEKLIPVPDSYQLGDDFQEYAEYIQDFFDAWIGQITGFDGLAAGEPTNPEERAEADLDLETVKGVVYKLETDIWATSKRHLISSLSIIMAVLQQGGMEGEGNGYDGEQDRTEYSEMWRVVQVAAGADGPGAYDADNEHGYFSVEDWADDVRNGNTYLGYSAWVDKLLAEKTAELDSDMKELFTVTGSDAESQARRVALASRIDDLRLILYSDADDHDEDTLLNSEARNNPLG